MNKELILNIQYDTLDCGACAVFDNPAHFNFYSLDFDDRVVINNNERLWVHGEFDFSDYCLMSVKYNILKHIEKIIKVIPNNDYNDKLYILICVRTSYTMLIINKNIYVFQAYVVVCTEDCFDNNDKRFYETNYLPRTLTNKDIQQIKDEAIIKDIIE
jgi:hypothetical protein